MDCPACASESDSVPLAAHAVGRTAYHLYRCPACDMQFWDPRATVSDYYTERSALTSGVGLQKLRIWHYPFFRHFPRQGGQLLDVGCEDGAFLAALKGRGFDACGCDFDIAAVDAGVNRRGIRSISPSSLQDFARTGRKFDVVTFFEVLEHQDSPAVFLGDVKMVLEDGGWIAGSVPNRDRLIIKREPQDYPPCHFMYFSERSLRNLLRHQGFTDISIRKDGYRISDLGIYLETQVLSDWGMRLKKRIKKKAMGVSDAAASAISIEHLPASGLAGPLALKLLKRFRNTLFLLPALAMKPVLNPHLYFQARLTRQP